MKLHGLGVCFAAAIALTSQTAGAQVIRGCPAGQAIQGIDFSRHALICVPIPAAVDLPGEAAARSAADAALQTNLNSEASSRSGMDATLLMAIQKEMDDRKAADQALQDSIGAETGLKGQYSFTGTAMCLNSSTGFRTDFELVPLIPPPPGPGTVLTAFSNAISGVRTFNGDGTGSVVATVHGITYPSQIVGGVSFSTGAATVSTLEANFTYVVNPDRTLVIDDGPTNGVITKGGSRVGWGVSTLGVPRFVGHISKDWRTIDLVHEDMVVEQSINTSPPSITPPQRLVTDRVCHRERTLRKIHD